MKRSGISALALSTLLLAISASAQQYGHCTVTGKRGSVPIKPAVAGQLTVQTTLPVPGWFNGDTPAAIKDGFEYCMAANIAWRAGLPKVVVRNVAFDAMVVGQTGRAYDLALAEATITPERKKVVDFSVPYFSSDQGVLVKKASGVTAANIATKRIGVQAGTTAREFVNAHIRPKQSVRVFPDPASLFTALSAGQIDAAILDTAIVLAQAGGSGGKLEVVGQYRTGEQYGAIFPKGSPNEAALNRIITDLKQEGVLKKLSQDYLARAFGGDPTSVPYFK